MTMCALVKYPFRWLFFIIKLCSYGHLRTLFSDGYKNQHPLQSSTFLLLYDVYKVKTFYTNQKIAAN